MTDVPVSSRIYARLLTLYPADLRREYGAEMALVFAEDLEAARFKLAMHEETRQVPVAALVVAKSGKLGPQI